MRPTPWHVKPIPTAFMDYETGKGVTSDGVPFTANITPGRKKPTLTDKLNTAAQLRVGGAPVTRILFTGKIPPNDRNTRHWLLVKTPGWETPRGHWLGTPVTGRFDNTNTLQKIDIKTAGEWFGDTPLTPSQAAQAWNTLESVLRHFFHTNLQGASPLMLTPAATGQNLWAHSLPGNYNPTPLDPDVTEELHRTSTQHHLDHLVAGDSIAAHPDVIPLIDPAITPKIPAFSYVDGRFMYASLCRELGTGPGHRLTGKQATDLWRENPYIRARFAVKFTVPDTWRHLGILGLPFEETTRGWYYPNRPGSTGTTWVDAAELFIAQKYGWHFTIHEGILFSGTKSSQRKRYEPGASQATRRTVAARPLDTWAKKLQDARDAAANHPDLNPTVSKAISAALRAILIQTIGAFASRGRSYTAITYDPKTIPPQAQSSVRQKGTAFIYDIPQHHNTRQAAFYRPEYSVQIWGRGRARVLHQKVNGIDTGALTLPGESIIGINGDAIYSTVLPSWSLPTEHGGADDGRSGRLRIQGYLEGNLTTPTTRTMRDKLRDKALKSTYTPGDNAIFEHEFIPPADTLDYTPALETENNE